MGGPVWPVAKPAELQVKPRSVERPLEISRRTSRPAGLLVCKLTLSRDFCRLSSIG